jgi:Zn-dependent protease
MVAKEHDGDERDDGEEADQRGAFSGHGGELQPESAAAPRVEGEPSFDAVGEVPALPQLGAEIRDRKVAIDVLGGGHAPEYSTGPVVVSPDLSMNSDDSGGSARAPKSRFTKFLSGTALAITIVLLKLKALVFIAFDYLRSYAVNPFEGFGLGQFAIAGGSMAVSVAAYAIVFRQYPFALVFGFLMIILIHEIGHAVVIRAKGLRAGVMVFIPFIGGAVTLKDQPRSAYDDAQIGLAGPIFGTAASLIVLQLYKWLGQPVYLAIALAGFMVNLINLVPIGMLDGGRISGAVTKWMWVFGGGWVVYKVVRQPNPLMVIILVLVAFQVYASIVREKSDKAFYDVTLGQRAGIAAAYFILVIFLGHQTYVSMHRLAALAK